MIKLALTVSQHFEKIEKELYPLIDCVVLRQEVHLEKNFEGKECIFHTNGFIDETFDVETNNTRVLEKLNKKVSLISFDIGPSCRKVELTESGYVGTSPVLSSKEILSAMEMKLKAIRQVYKGGISLENLDYQPTGAYEHVCEAEFIKKAVNSLGVGLTLDIGHLGVSCHHLRCKPENYIDALPLNNLKEIHISRSEKTVDTHKLPQEHEYALLEYILKKATPEYVTLEYYESPEKIVEGYKQLRKFLHKSAVNV